MSNVQLLRPRSLEEALDALDRTGGDATIMAGGTIVMYAYHAQLLSPSVLVYLGNAGLDGVRNEDGGVSVGATTTLLDTADALADTTAGAGLADAVRQIGTRALQAQGTLGGNLFAPPPSGDLIPALIALGARVRLRSKDGQRELAVEEFVQDLGTTAIRDGEILTELVLPANAGRLGYERFTYSRGLAPAIVTAAVAVDVDAQGSCRAARIAVAGAGPKAFRATRAEQALVGQSLRNGAARDAGRLAAEESEPEDDGLASAWYRRKLTAVLVERALHAAQGGQA
jgi:aerobic carbon-monoxide dehydrogenase medium subunit